MECEVTAIVTAHRRVNQTLKTLEVLNSCDPVPAEILVHVDGDETETLRAVRERFPSVRYFLSSENLGPGGGRNKLIAAARCEIVASFDDDSFPIDSDYFSRVLGLFDEFPGVAVLNGSVFHQHEEISPAFDKLTYCSDFSGGACAYRRGVFLDTGGYVALPVAYGMEEVDLALRLHASGERILRSHSLRVFHDTDLGRHACASVTSASIANTALLAWLRYPVTLCEVQLISGPNFG